MTVTEFLQSSVPFLNGLTREQAHSLAVAAAQEKFPKGATVLFRGTTVDGLCVVASGKVEVWAAISKSKTLSKVAELGAGEVFGETSIIERGTAGAMVKASEDETLIFVIPQDSFREVLTQNPEFPARAQALMADRKKKNAELARPPVLAAA